MVRFWDHKQHEVVSVQDQVDTLHESHVVSCAPVMDCNNVDPFHVDSEPQVDRQMIACDDTLFDLWDLAVADVGWGLVKFAAVSALEDN